MAKRKPVCPFGKWRQYPKYDAYRGGCKVAWHYYKDEARARECAEVANHNRRIAEWEGYDHGYCCPGSVRMSLEGEFHPGMWEVCVP
jgi:hypothetical protein